MNSEPSTVETFDVVQWLRDHKGGLASPHYIDSGINKCYMCTAADEIERLRAIEQRAVEEKRSHGDADPAHEVERQVWECMHYVLTGEELDAE